MFKTFLQQRSLINGISPYIEDNQVLWQVYVNARSKIDPKIRFQRRIRGQRHYHRGSGDYADFFLALLVVAACICWGLDNNFTRDIEDLPATVLASVKGWIAGGFNICLALILGTKQATFSQVAGTLTIGALSFGLSLVLFIHALRLIGASRTSTYFATGPFVGMIFAVLFLRENPSLQQWIASLFMAGGVWILYHERHSHVHSHESMTHRHRHSSSALSLT